jgi:hypothetical protein
VVHVGIALIAERLGLEKRGVLIGPDDALAALAPVSRVGLPVDVVGAVAEEDTVAAVVGAFGVVVVGK